MLGNQKKDQYCYFVQLFWNHALTLCQRNNELIHLYAESISEAISASLSSGSIPSKFEIAFNHSVFFKKNLAIYPNYRDISNLSFLGKLLEHSLSVHFKEHMAFRNLFEEFQSGFRTNHTRLSISMSNQYVLIADDCGLQI